MTLSCTPKVPCPQSFYPKKYHTFSFCKNLKLIAAFYFSIGDDVFLFEDIRFITVSPLAASFPVRFCTWTQPIMRLLTHNMLICNKKGVKNGYPLKIRANRVCYEETDFR